QAGEHAPAFRIPRSFDVERRSRERPRPAHQVGPEQHHEEDEEQAHPDERAPDGHLGEPSLGVSTENETGRQAQVEGDEHRRQRSVPGGREPEIAHQPNPEIVVGEPRDRQGDGQNQGDGEGSRHGPTYWRLSAHRQVPGPENAPAQKLPLRGAGERARPLGGLNVLPVRLTYCCPKSEDATWIATGLIPTETRLKRASGSSPSNPCWSTKVPSALAIS